MLLELKTNHLRGVVKRLLRSVEVDRDHALTLVDPTTSRKLKLISSDLQIHPRRNHRPFPSSNLLYRPRFLLLIHFSAKSPRRLRHSNLSVKVYYALTVRGRWLCTN